MLVATLIRVVIFTATHELVSLMESKHPQSSNRKQALLVHAEVFTDMCYIMITDVALLVGSVNFLH